MKKYPDFDSMSKSAKILSSTLNYICSIIKPGVTTIELDSIATDFITSHSGAEPAFIGYGGFPCSICASVNDVVVHGVPSSVELRDGDIISVDCGVLYNKAYSDACRTVCVGECDSVLLDFIKAGYNALDSGISKAIAGNRVGDISFAIQSSLEMSGYNVSRDFVGHYIGYTLHSLPYIPNYGRANTGQVIKVGDYMAIEPIYFMGSWKTVQRGPFDMVSCDGSYGAQVEDTIYISENGPIVLTR
jgi:methionyl aminopeptidase